MDIKVERQVLADILNSIIEGANSLGYVSLASNLDALKADGLSVTTDSVSIAKRVQLQLNYQVMENMGKGNPEFLSKGIRDIKSFIADKETSGHWIADYAMVLGASFTK